MAVTTFVYPPAGSITITGAATEAKQDVMITSLQLLDDAISTTGSAVPTKSNQVSGTDGTNARVLKTDAAGELQIDVLSSALPSGAATESTLSALNGKVVAVDTGSVTISAALPAGTNNIGDVDVLSLPSIPAGSNNIGSITDITGTVSLPTGAATEATLSTLNGKVPANLTVTSTRLLVDGSGVTQPVSATNLDIRDLSSASDSVAAVQSGTWTVQPGNTANTTAWLVKEEVATTATVTSVNDSASSQSLLASNSARKGAMFFNDSSSTLYLKLGTTASTTSYTVQIASLGYYELPNTKVYTGAIDGIWSADSSGAVRITELT